MVHYVTDIISYHVISYHIMSKHSIIYYSSLVPHAELIVGHLVVVVEPGVVRRAHLVDMCCSCVVV